MGLDLFRRLKTTSFALALLAGSGTARAQAPAEQNAWDTPEGLVTQIYDEVSFESGKVPDWETVRAMFIPEAVVVLRTSREATTVFSVDGFINDFINFVENTPAGANGFTEKVLNLKSMVFGEMAHVLVLYEAHITGSQRPPSQGVDSFSLIKKDGRWWIVAITNEIPGPDRPVPQMLLN
jgi:hypothetical protein